MNVLIIDDHSIFRQGMKSLLNTINPAIDVAESDSISCAVDQLKQQDFELVLLDLNLGDSQGVETIDKIISLHEVVMVVSGDIEPPLIAQAMQKGIVGYLPKVSSPKVMHKVIDLILNGGVYIPPEILSIIPRQPSAEQLSFHDLTLKQTEVLGFVMKGLSNKVIAHEMKISEGTVKAHLSAAYKTLGVTSRSEAILALSGHAMN